MGTIVTRTDTKGNVSYQAKVRKAGYPAMSQTFPDRLEAEAWMKARELEIQQGKNAPTSRGTSVTVGELVTRYLKEVTPRKRGADVERFHIRAIENSDLVKYTVSTLPASAVRQWRDARLERVSPSTVNRQLNILHHIIEHARKEWDISGGPNPVSDVTRPEGGGSRDRRLSQDEEARLMAAARESRGGYLVDLIVLALETSMRQGELVGLLWTQVDLGNRCIVLQEGKTKNGEGRGVPLSARAVEVLAKRAERLRGQTRVFPGLTREAVKQAFRRTTERAGVEDFHFHDLRHEAASRFFEKGLNVMEAASITGHKDLKMLRRYTHLNAAKLAAKLD